MQRIHAHIDRNLASTDLSPTSIAAAHFISTRHLHGLFQEQGTSVSTWIRIRRLERCRRDLVNPLFADRPVCRHRGPLGLRRRRALQPRRSRPRTKCLRASSAPAPLIGILPGRARRLTIGARYVPRALSTAPHDRTMGGSDPHRSGSPSRSLPSS